MIFYFKEGASNTGDRRVTNKENVKIYTQKLLRQISNRRIIFLLTRKIQKKCNQ